MRNLRMDDLNTYSGARLGNFPAIMMILDSVSIMDHFVLFGIFDAWCNIHFELSYT